ncbi:hypothetical protein AB4Z10_22825 [Bosea sp. RAF48]|uniref:hypothetical protein n=1 Tax=Bosea sp. RAF48 TaxID=3237480 RepID=UPI003F8F5C49
MSWLGNAAVAIWCDLEPGTEAAHDVWHSQEHVPERLGVPGFLRARRGISAAAGSGQRFVLYEIDTLQTLTSPAYLQCLNNPSAWTTRTMPTVRKLSRTACRVSASLGTGAGSFLLTGRFAGREGIEADIARLAERLPAIASLPGISGAHLLACEAAGTRMDTAEQRLRRGADDQADWILVVEAYDRAALDMVQAGETRAAAPHAGEAGSKAAFSRFEISFVMVPGDLPVSEVIKEAAVSHA